MSGWLARTGTGLVGAVVEAWAELRIHRTRVLLSLLGVAVAVTAITSVVGLGAVVQQAQTEQMERQSGRPASLSVSMYSESGEGMPYADQRALLAEVADRYGITWSTVRLVRAPQYMHCQPSRANTARRVILRLCESRGIRT